MSDDQRLDELIGRIYDAALDETLWPSLAPEIARTFDSHSAALQTRERGKVELLALSANFEPSLMRDYQAYYWQRDLWVERATKLGLLKVVASKDLISDAEFERTEYRHDWCHKTDIYYVVGAVFPVGEDQIAALGVHRRRAAGTYEEVDKSRVARFLPHLRRALQIRQRLALPAIEKQAAFDAVERTGIATLVVGRDGQIIHANREAEALLHAADAIRAIGRRLATAQRSVSERLASLIREAVDMAAQRGGTAGGAIAIPRDDRLPVTVLVAPFRPAQNGLGASAPAAILFIRDPEQPPLPSLTLKEIFGFTPAEAAIASALADGKTVEDIATSYGVSLNTVRTHLKTVFAKTGTNRQVQLVALLLRSVAAITPG